MLVIHYTSDSLFSQDLCRDKIDTTYKTRCPSSQPNVFKRERENGAKQVCYVNVMVMSRMYRVTSYSEQTAICKPEAYTSSCHGSFSVSV